ncbi:MAG: hypothetical protein M3389_15220, partial [Actinomycetota bacterium]|nr:hypothetical protein [Actinomycetota bacterium]
MTSLLARPTQELSEQERNQLFAHRSNANFLAQNVARTLAASEAARAADPAGEEAQRNRAALAPLKEAITAPENRDSVLTRDIMSGELKGLTMSRRLMSVNERQGDAIGPIRNRKDFYRGGGAGVYTRFVSAQRIDAEREAAD